MISHSTYTRETYEMSEVEILQAYEQPGHEIAFSAPQRVADYFKISEKKAKQIISRSDAYNLHKEYKRPKTYNPYFVYRRRELLQADLIEIRQISGQNDGVNYLLLIIDIFSRKIWVFPMETKTAVETVNVFSAFLHEIRRGRRVKEIMTDAGKEFCNRLLQHLLRTKRIKHRIASGTCKASYAERANKSIQILIYKYLTNAESLRYIDALPNLVETYNKRAHRSLQKMCPNDADLPRNEVRVRGIHIERYMSIQRKKPTLAVGDTVRVKTDSKQIVDARRAYAEQYHGELYKIVAINVRLPIPLYYIKSMNTLERIKDGFYSNELSKVSGDVFKIDRVISWRGRGRNRQALVRWKYFDSQWDEWIPEENILRRY